MFTIGIDFGTLSGRAVLVDTRDGRELASAVLDYPHAVIDEHLPGSDARLPAEWALQDPLDYLAVVKETVPQVLDASGVHPSDVVGLGIDFTSCTMLPTKADGTPLRVLDEWQGNKHAWVKLWKHHAAQPQADRINQVAERRGETWLARYGGKYSSEWFFSKALEILEDAPDVYQAADRLIEACDWVIWQLTGVETRNVTTAGYKAMVQDGAFPDRAFFAALNPDFADVVDEKMMRTLSPLGQRAGGLTAEWAEATGLQEGTAVAVANVDAHVTSPAVKATEPGEMVAIMGTSTCHILIGENASNVPGMCGVVDGGIVPDAFGYEAGQNSVGDVFAWFVQNAVPGWVERAAEAEGLDVYGYLEREASKQAPGEHGLVALDWWSGNRSTLVDTDLSGMILGITMATRPAEIYRALIEATAFGTREIIEAFERSGVPVRTIVAAGGLPEKSPLIRQIYADVTGRPLALSGSAQAPALGSSMYAAVAAGVYPDIHAASARMGKRSDDVVHPNPDAQGTYDELYAEYKRLYDTFGRGDNDAMKRLSALRRSILAERAEATS